MCVGPITSEALKKCVEQVKLLNYMNAHTLCIYKDIEVCTYMCVCIHVLYMHNQQVKLLVQNPHVA